MDKFLNFELFEKQRKELLAKAHPDRKQRISDIQVVYDYAKIKNKILQVDFSTNTISNDHTWHQKLHFLEENPKTDIKSLKDLVKGNLKVFCECPDFLYKGFKYIGTVQEYGIETEDRKPVVTNPELQGTVCKHLIAVMFNLDKYVNSISKDL